MTPEVSSPTRFPALIVAPSSLVSNWVREIGRFAPELEVIDFTGSRRHRLIERLDASHSDDKTACDVVVTSYGTLRRDIVELGARRYDTVVLDEAQAIKNRSSRTSRACRRLVADHRIALSGTPVENHLGEAVSIFEFLNPGMLPASLLTGAALTQGNAATRDEAQPRRRPETTSSSLRAPCAH